MNKQIHKFDKPKDSYQPLSSFQSENRYRRQKDEELAEIEKQIAEAEKTEDEVQEAQTEVDQMEDAKDEAASKQDKQNWEKRYSDLRSYASKKENEYQKQLKDLQKKLQQIENKPEFPTTDEEYEEWVSKYPKVAAAMQTMILKNTQSMDEKVEQTRAELEQEKMELQKQRAMGQLLKLHPDFFEVAATEEWQEWLEQQPRAIQNTIHQPEGYDDESVRSAARTIQIFKQEQGLQKRKTSKDTPDSKQAAKSVSRSVSDKPQTDDGKKIWKESDISKLSTRDFEKYQDEILEAQREGRFEYDISGAAR